MKIAFAAAAWGCPGDGFAAQCRLVAEAGFTAIEVQPERSASGVREQARICAGHGLGLILQPHTQGRTATDHAADLAAHLANAAVVRPWLVTCHTGLDHFGLDANLALHDAGQAWSRTHGIPVLHEIHRKRIAWNALVGGELVRHRQDLAFTADLSHWVVAHENWLEDPGYGLAGILPRCHAIHARVGHPQGPQVPDPRSARWRPALDRHLAWWDTIVAARRTAGAPLLVVCPEFGPPDYCPSDPEDGHPLVDIFAINCWMRDLLAQRWNQGTAA